MTNDKPTLGELIWRCNTDNEAAAVVRQHGYDPRLFCKASPLIVAIFKKWDSTNVLDALHEKGMASAEEICKRYDINAETFEAEANAACGLVNE